MVTSTDLFEEKKLGLLKFSLIKGDFRKFEGSWKIKKNKDNSKNSLIYDLTVQGLLRHFKKEIEKRNNLDPIVQKKNNIPYLVDQHLLDKKNKQDLQ